MWSLKIKVIAGLSVIVLIATLTNVRYLSVIATASNIIQVIMFVLWYFEENPIPKKTVEQVAAIYAYTNEEKSKNTKKEEFIKKLLEEGVIETEELQKAIDKLRDDEIFLVHSYGEGTPQRLKEAAGLKTTPLMSILHKLGFVRVFGKHNLFLIPVKDLPQPIRTTKALEQFLISEIEKTWKDLQQKALEQFPAKDYKIMEKWRAGEGYRLSYVISKTPKKDIVAGFKNRPSFTNDFVAVILRRITPSQDICLVRDTVKLKELLKKISIALFLADIPPQLKQKITSNEKLVKENLGIATIFDLRNVPLERITNEIQKIEPSTPNPETYSKKLISEAKEFSELLESLGVTDL